MQVVKSQDRRGNSTDRLAFTTERRMTWVLDPSHEAGCARLTRTRRRPPSFVTPRTTIFQGLRRDAEDCAETGPSVKPSRGWSPIPFSSSTSSMRLALALAQPCTASPEHATRAVGSRAPCGGWRRTRAAGEYRSIAAEHRRTSLCYYLGNRATAFHTGQCAGPDLLCGVDD